VRGEHSLHNRPTGFTGRVEGMMNPLVNVEDMGGRVEYLLFLLTIVVLDFLYILNYESFDVLISYLITGQYPICQIVRLR